MPTYTKIWHNASYAAISPTLPSLSVAGKTVFVSGGGYGIGREIVKAFAAATAAHIVITGRNDGPLQAVKSEVEASSSKTKVHVFPADITDEKVMSTIFSKIDSTIGPIDVLVANAGFLADPAALSLASSLADWWRGFEVNVLGGIILARHFVKSARKDNAIFINVTTSLVHAGTFPTFSSYGASKTAFVRAVDFLQVENPTLRFVNVNPGVVKTEMNAKSGIITMPYDDSKYDHF
jgi:NAD(P)-dependent dehydrogenase (short-subunit alcohol dehydrogenase family)